MRKKVLSALLALVMVLSLVPMGVLAAANNVTLEAGDVEVTVDGANLWGDAVSTTSTGDAVNITVDLAKLNTKADAFKTYLTDGSKYFRYSTGNNITETTNGAQLCMPISIKLKKDGVTPNQVVCVRMSGSTNMDADKAGSNGQTGTSISATYSDDKTTVAEWPVVAFAGLTYNASSSPAVSYTNTATPFAFNDKGSTGTLTTWKYAVTWTDSANNTYTKDVTINITKNEGTAQPAAPVFAPASLAEITGMDAGKPTQNFQSLTLGEADAASIDGYDKVYHPTGTLTPVSGWTAYWPGNTEQQSGYFAAIKVSGLAEGTVVKVGGVPAGTATADNSGTVIAVTRLGGDEITLGADGSFPSVAGSRIGMLITIGETKYLFVFDKVKSTVLPDPGPAADDVAAAVLAEMKKTGYVIPATLNDTRTGSDKVIDLTTAYSASAAAGTGGKDINVTVTAKDLQRHQNADTPESLGYWVGVNFPKAVTIGENTWTLTTYKRDNKEADTLSSGDFTGDILGAYYNVAEAKTEIVTDATSRPVELTYTCGETTKVVKVLVDLTKVETVMPPAPAASNDGTLNEAAQNTIKDAITAAANTEIKNNGEDAGVRETPVVSVDFGTAAGAGVAGTIPAEIVSSLKEANTDPSTDVELKIVGNDGAEAKLSTSTIGTLGSGDLKPLVKAKEPDTSMAGNVNAEQKTAVETILTTAKNENATAVTVEMTQGSTPLFNTPNMDVAITVKVPVPNNTYDAVLHIGKNGSVTKHTNLTVQGNATDGYYLEVVIHHLSTLVGAKGAALAAIPEATSGYTVPLVKFVDRTDLSAADKKEFFGGKLIIKNPGANECTYVVSIGDPSIQLNGKELSICKVVTLAAKGTAEMNCQNVFKVHVAQIPKGTDISQTVTGTVVVVWTPVTSLKNTNLGG